MPVNLDLDLIKARLAAATPGPWVLSKDRETITQTSHITRDVWTIPRTHEDMELIAHAPSDLAALIAEVERLRVELEQERAATVTFLRGGAEAHERFGRSVVAPILHEHADYIERGEHRREEEP